MIAKTYYYLTKPGIIMGNLVTTAGGFALASRGDFNPLLFLETLAGLGLVIAAACVFNNYTDREIDAKMERTKQRPLVSGLISGPSAILFAALLSLAGLGILIQFTNLLTAFVTLAGFVVYVILYALLKCRSIHGTFVGSLAGAVPPVVGYCAVSGRFDLAASLLFAIMVLWQMPHFFAIAMYRLSDYTAASIPILPVKKGIRITQMHMHAYILLFLGAALLLTYFGYTGMAFAAIAALLGVTWLILCFRGLKRADNTLWARSMFRYSLVVITALFLALSLDAR